MALSDEKRGTRIVKLKADLWLDPDAITVLAAVNCVRPFRQEGIECRARLLIETKTGNHTVGYRTLLDAQQAGNTLAAIANHRATEKAQRRAEFARRRLEVERRTDYTGTPMPGDADYEPNGHTPP